MTNNRRTHIFVWQTAGDAAQNAGSGCRLTSSLPHKSVRAPIIRHFMRFASSHIFASLCAMLWYILLAVYLQSKYMQSKVNLKNFKGISKLRGILLTLSIQAFEFSHF